MKNSEWDKYFPHFLPEEFLSPEGLLLFHQKNVMPFDPIILLKLETLRRNLNFDRLEGVLEAEKEVYIVINTNKNNLRGFVTPGEWYTKRTKEEDQYYSFHLWCAADISSNVDVKTLIAYAKHVGFTGIIEYDWGVHLDVRRGDKYIHEI